MDKLPTLDHNANSPCPFIGGACPKDKDKCRNWVGMPYMETGVISARIVQKWDCILIHLATLTFSVNVIMGQALRPISGPMGVTGMPPGGPKLPPMAPPMG